jgi:hypothetical protein
MSDYDHDGEEAFDECELMGFMSGCRSTHPRESHDEFEERLRRERQARELLRSKP